MIHFLTFIERKKNFCSQGWRSHKTADALIGQNFCFINANINVDNRSGERDKKKITKKCVNYTDCEII